MTIQTIEQLWATQKAYTRLLGVVDVIDGDPDMPEDFQHIPKDMRKMMTDMRMAIVEYKNKHNIE